MVYPLFVSFYVNSDFEAKDVVVEIVDIGKVEFDKLLGKKLVEFNINSKELVSGLNLRIRYEDSETNKYDEKRSYPLVVKNVPFYVRWWVGFRELI